VRKKHFSRQVRKARKEDAKKNLGRVNDNIWIFEKLNSGEPNWKLENQKLAARPTFFRRSSSRRLGPWRALRGKKTFLTPSPQRRRKKNWDVGEK
jgi:hypothetical protein